MVCLPLDADLHHCCSEGNALLDTYNTYNKYSLIHKAVANTEIKLSVTYIFILVPLLKGVIKRTQEKIIYSVRRAAERFIYI